jgi:uncharacterized CHY-type Zn-finger protein|tara:strand:+ start:1300 stop:1842 length:543 start_codon:yes stop_codon:yes gene_type:complete
MGQLRDTVMKEMRVDIDVGDWTAIDELLKFVPRKNLIGYLPEEQQDKFKQMGYICTECGFSVSREDFYGIEGECPTDDCDGQMEKDWNGNIKRIFEGEQPILTEDDIFRNLNAEEEETFRQHTRETYKPHSEINPVWHPVVRDECRRINENTKFCADCGEEVTPDEMENCPNCGVWLGDE